MFYVGLLGLGWDILYNYLQRYMWDHDWPGVFLFFGAIAEGILLGLLIKFVGLLYIPRDLPLGWFVIHYSLVSVIAYLGEGFSLPIEIVGSVIFGFFALGYRFVTYSGSISHSSWTP